jgi:hypothetical protein
VTNLLRFSFTGIVLLGAIAARPNVSVRANEVVAQATSAPNLRVTVVPYPGHFFAVQLETNKQMYTLGEPVKIRVSITNVTSEPYNILYWPLVGMFPLLIQDSSGAQIAPTVPGVLEGPINSSEVYQLAPRGTVTTRWIEIRNYGYALTQPGAYTVTTSLCGVGAKLTSGGTESFGLGGKDKSNAVQIQIRPLP